MAYAYSPIGKRDPFRSFFEEFQAGVQNPDLTEKGVASRAGTITMTGRVQKQGGGWFPVWAVRSGDYVTVPDRVGEPNRRITQTSYDHASRTVSADVGNRVARVDATLARLDVGGT